MPSIDHITPLARGGKNEPDNWITVSYRTNSAKSIWTLEQLNISLQPPGSILEWDGMLHFFVKYIKANPEIIDNKLINKWVKPALKLLKEK